MSWHWRTQQGPPSCSARDPPPPKTLSSTLQAAGCSLLAIHGRTRDQKDGSQTRASWEHLRAVVAAVRIPVLVNGNVLCIQDAERWVRCTPVQVQ
jgi:tRNA-dihydrouridine synthase 1